jgi:hypothetical protein
VNGRIFCIGPVERGERRLEKAISFLGEESKISRYVKRVRGGNKLYLYLAEMATTADGSRQEKIIRRVNEEEARTYGWKKDSCDQNQTAELQEHETPPARPVEQEPVESGESAIMLTSTTPEAPLKEAPKEEPEEGFSIEPSDLTKQEAAGTPDKEEFTVVPRPRGFYALEPLGPHAPRGYVMVKTDGSTTRVFCGLCPGFTCSHVEFMHKWLRTHRGNP